MVKVLKEMFDQTALFDTQTLTAVLLVFFFLLYSNWPWTIPNERPYLEQDLTNYKYEKIVTKSLAVLNKYFSSRMNMFKSAVQAQVNIPLPYF